MRGGRARFTLAAMFIPLPTIIRGSAFAGAAFVIAQICVFFSTGVGQDPLQFFHLPEDYAALLLKNPLALRVTLGFDALFLVAFSVMFYAVFARLLELGAQRTLVFAAVACTSLLGLLDLLENFHFLTLLGAAEQGVVPSLAHIQFQVWESLFKFHVGYLGIFLLGLVLPRSTAGERALAFACCWVSLPVGVLIYVVPAPYSTWFLFARFGFFLYALCAMGWLFGVRASTAPSVTRGAVGSSALA
jgi:hypothetical protein